MFLCGGVNRSDIKNFFLVRITKTLVGESQPAKNDQDNSNPSDRFHILCPLRLGHALSALNQIEDEDDQSGEQQDMDETAESVGRDKTQEPENA